MHSVFLTLLLLLLLLFRGSALLIQALRITFKLNCTLAKSFALSKAASDLTPLPLSPPSLLLLTLSLPLSLTPSWRFSPFAVHSSLHLK